MSNGDQNTAYAAAASLFTLVLTAQRHWIVSDAGDPGPAALAAKVAQAGAAAPVERAAEIESL